MKAKELRGRSQAELETQLHDLLKEQFNLRMQKGSGQLSRPSQFKVVRRSIARVKTIMAQLSAGERK
jgi:large subunit ribosomal protein L29